MRGEMERLPHSEKMEFEDFEFEVEGLGALIRQTITDRLEKNLAECPPRLSLPMRWGPNEDGDGGPPVSDPLTIYLRLPLDKGRDAECIWSITLTELLDYELFDGPDGPTTMPWGDEDWNEATERALTVIEALRVLADKLAQRVQTRT